MKKMKIITFLKLLMKLRRIIMLLLFFFDINNFIDYNNTILYENENNENENKNENKNENNKNENERQSSILNKKNIIIIVIKGLYPLRQLFYL
jgi:hypothetical protein